MARTAKIEDWQVEDARRLDVLFKERARLSQGDFGAQYGIGTQGMVWQYLSGTRPLNIKAAMAFSRGLDVLIDQFSTTLADQIRDAMERVQATSKWPFASIDFAKIQSLRDKDRTILENAMLEAAAQAGLDVKK